MLSRLKQWLAGSDPVSREPSEQAEVDRECRQLQLYHFQACPFCRVTRNSIRRLRLPIEERDIRRDPRARDELLAGGGRATVPCLRIDTPEETHWMYESTDIIRYLEKRFG